MYQLPEYKFESGEDKFQNLISQAPVLINTFKGPSFIVDSINKTTLEIWGKSYEEVINKPLFESSPELEDSVKELLNKVYTTGETFIANEIPVQLKRTDKPKTAYFNTVYQPLRDVDNKIYGIIVIGTEVTETVNNRKLIETSELLNRTILESSPDCLKILDLEGRIQFINYSGLCDLEIDDFSTFKNKNWWSLWGSENEALVRESVDKARQGETSKFTAFCSNVKGTSKWWNVVVAPVLKPGEPIQQIISVSRDITEQKKSQEAIDKMGSHLKLATDAANVGVWSLNIQSQELEWSDLHKKMWGYDVNRTDLKYEDWHKLLIPEDKVLALKRMENARINHSFYEVEYRINKADDNVIRFMRSVGKYYYNDKGEAETLTGISIDITEQKEAEKKIKESENQFRTFADSIQNLAWIANGDGWIYWYNQRWYDYTGTTLEVMEGWGWQKVHHPDYSKKVVDLLKEAWKKDEAWELTFPLRRHDGEYRWFLTRAYPVKDASGKIERWIGTNTDVTEQKSFSEELEKKVNERTEELAVRTKQLEEINKTLDLNNIALENANAELKSFSYIASHDLQEPLRMIKMFSKRIIEAEIFSDKTQKYFNLIITATERMRNLIISLIDFSRIDKTELNFVTCNLNNIVEESKSDLQLSITEKQAIIVYENLPTINGMYIQLSQLFSNLISNAIKYSRPEIVPHIKITSERIYGKDTDHPAAVHQLEYYAIKIADNGIGFDKENATKIFEVFERLHTRNEYSGTGIGLSIVKKIVNNHNGFIVAEGKPDVGSTFTLCIPAA